jgi:hypothetical protein
MSRVRRERLDEIMGLLRQNDGHLRVSQLCETLGYRYGTTETTVWDYLGALKAAGRVNYKEANPILGKVIDIELVEENPGKWSVSELKRIYAAQALRQEVKAKKRGGKGWTGLIPRI